MNNNEKQAMRVGTAAAVHMGSVYTNRRGEQVKVTNCRTEGNTTGSGDVLVPVAGGSEVVTCRKCTAGSRRPAPLPPRRPRV